MAQSLAGQGKCLSKTKSQCETLSSRRLSIAGTTGASVTEDMWHPSDESVDVQCPQSEVYLVNFLQLFLRMWCSDLSATLQSVET